MKTVRNERRIYPVTDAEFNLIALQPVKFRNRHETIADLISPNEARTKLHWKIYEVDRGNGLIIYTEGFTVLFARKRVKEYHAGMHIFTDRDDLLLATCSLCLCDHKARFCTFVKLNILCPECHQEYLRAKADDYIVRRKQATPKWADAAEIEKFYAEARYRTFITGIPHHVDHIIPIRGKEASGLHVHWNLQILTAEENIRKSNKLPVELYPVVRVSK